MSNDVKWLKLDVNILDDEKIKIIRALPDGNNMFILWIGLLCLAMKNDRFGYIEICDGIPYDVDSLANILNLPFKTVQSGLNYFQKFGMIDTHEGGVIEIINFMKHQSVESLERVREQNRIRQQTYRDKQKALPAKNEEKSSGLMVIENTLFNEFWNIVTHKQDRTKSEKAFNRIPKSKQTETIEKYQQQKEMYLRNNPKDTVYQFFKRPLTWLNGKCWNDEIEYKPTNESKSDMQKAWEKMEDL